MDISFIGSEIDLKWMAIAKWMHNFEFNPFITLVCDKNQTCTWRHVLELVYISEMLIKNKQNLIPFKLVV